MHVKAFGTMIGISQYHLNVSQMCIITIIMLNSDPTPSGVFNILKFNVPIIVINISLTTVYLVKYLRLHYLITNFNVYPSKASGQLQQVGQFLLALVLATYLFFFCFNISILPAAYTGNVNLLWSYFQPLSLYYSYTFAGE